VLIFEQNEGTLLAKLAFLALKRCVMNIIISISRYTRNFLLRSIYYVRMDPSGTCP
jgi:hypothetical protein